MKISKFNTYSIKKLKPDTKPYDVQVESCKGMILRINPGGTVSILYRYQSDGKRRKMSLGSYSRSNLKGAKEAYDNATHLTENGTDPIEERKRIQQEEKNIKNVNELADDFIANHIDQKLRETTAKEYKRQIKKHIRPTWGGQSAKDIKRLDIVTLIEGIGKNSPVQANRVLSTIKKMFSYALEKSSVPTNPTIGIKPYCKEKPKDRVLELDELTNLLKLLQSITDENRVTADMLQLIILTAQRPGEVGEMRLSQLLKKNEETWWVLSSDDTKNKEANHVYLSQWALTIIKNRVKDFNLDNYIFPAKTKLDITTKSNSTSSHVRKDVLVAKVKRLQSVLPEWGIDPFTAHDLRRSAATGIAQIGHAGIVPDILNHKPVGITRTIYEKYNRLPEIKRALWDWGDTLQEKLKEKDQTRPFINVTNQETT